jgi:hypothetical protein
LCIGHSSYQFSIFCLSFDVTVDQKATRSQKSRGDGERERERAAVTGLLFVAISDASVMITTTAAGGICLDRAPLCPPPLHIQKKSRKATLRRRIFRKSTPTYSDDQYVFGPLDDIIDEIKSDIWESPPDYSFDSSVFDWAHPLRAPLSWTVAPLPVSRTPSDHPLTIRKNRNSRSSASGSSFGDPMAFSRKNSQAEPENGGPVRSLHTTAATPWPLIDVTSNEPAHPLTTDGAEHMSAQQALENAISKNEGRTEPPKRRMSKLRLFTSGLPLLRRMNTEETSAGTSDTPDTTSPTAVASLAAHDEIEEGSEVKHPDEEAIEAYLSQIARELENTITCAEHLLRSSSGLKLGALMHKMGKHIPPTTDFGLEASEAQVSTSHLPTTLRAAVRLFPEVKLLTEEYQDIGIAIDIEGVLHNRKPLPDTSIDVIFVVDNA